MKKFKHFILPIIFSMSLIAQVVYKKFILPTGIETLTDATIVFFATVALTISFVGTIVTFINAIDKIITNNVGSNDK